MAAGHASTAAGGLSAWLIRARKKRGLSQAKLAVITGISQPLISTWETGKRGMSGADVEAITAALDRFDRDLRAGNVKLYTHQLSREPGTRKTAKSKGRRPKRVASVDFPQLARERFSANETYYRSGDELRAISLFTGCGGLCLGFKQAGYKVLGFVELDPGFRRTYQLNFPEPICLGDDIHEVSDSQLHEYASMFCPVDVLFGGPPCQGFSLAGKRDVNDCRNTLFQEQVRFIRFFAPKVVLMENVKLLTSMKAPDGRLVREHIVGAFRDAGYLCDYRELNAQDFGVPQFRERVFFIAVHHSVGLTDIPFPGPTHGPLDKGGLFGNGLKPYVTFRDATSDLESLESGEKSDVDPYHWAVKHPDRVLNWLRDVPEGRSAHDNEDPDLRPPCGYNTTYKRLIWDRPCSTIGTTFGMISGCRNVHPKCTRSLTVREALRCQAFPDNYQFLGTWGQIRTMIGNAVPPLMARVMAKHIRERILGHAAGIERAMPGPPTDLGEG